MWCLESVAGLKVFELCGNRAVLLSGIILFIVWRLLLQSVQLEMRLPPWKELAMLEYYFLVLNCLMHKLLCPGPEFSL